MKKLLTGLMAATLLLTSALPAEAVLRFNEDSAHTTADQGVMTLGVVTTSGAATSATDGDYAGLTLNAVGGLRVTQVGDTVGGLSVYSNLDIDESTATTTQQLKGSAGTLYSCIVSNNTAATVEYVKFYNATALTGSAAGTETPVITLPIAGASTIVVNFGAAGYSFSTGMTVAATTGIAVADTGAPAANAIVLNCFYK